MKRQKTTLFSISLFLGILFCFGLSTYSVIDAQINSVQISTGTNTFDDSLISDSDYSDDIQIEDSNIVCLATKRILNYLQHNFSILSHSTSFWQPPKFS